jgi:hypothetical protein
VAVNVITIMDIICIKVLFLCFFVFIGTNHNFCLIYMSFSLMSDNIVYMEIFLLFVKEIPTSCT